MPDTDPNNIRQAVADFQPRRRPRFQNLLLWRDVILELRGKGASCEAVAELLTRHGVKTSRTMVGEFLHTLAQPKTNGHRKPRLKPAARPAIQSPAPQLAAPIRRPEPAPIENLPVKTRGPHIAKVELLKPHEQYD